MQSTDPQSDIKGTGNCELWNRQVDCIRPPPVHEATVSNTTHPSNCHKQMNDQQKSHFPRARPSQKWHVSYDIGGKCSGMLRNSPLNIIQDAYNSARHQGTPCWIPLTMQQSMQQKSMDYFTDSHGSQCCMHYYLQSSYKGYYWTHHKSQVLTAMTGMLLTCVFV